jgi:DNA-directed RNA polymerase subunit RPC12/RpoP
MKKCIDCGKKLSTNPKAIRCLRCSNIYRWKDKKYKTKVIDSITKEWKHRKLPKIKCIDCGKELFDRRAIRCDKCNKNFRKNNKKHYECIDCGETITASSINGRCKSCAQLGELNSFHNKHHKEKTRKKISLSHGGTGIPYELSEYPIEFNSKLKEEIRIRDDYTCQKCKITEEEHLIVYGIKLDIHHIDYNKENCKKNNLITLCRECNLRVNFNREYWTEFFKNKLNIIKEIINNG